MLTNRSRTTPASDTPPGPRGGPIEVEHDTGRHPRSPTGCPVCDGALVQVECKLVCTRCHRIVENASGD